MYWYSEQVTRILTVLLQDIVTRDRMWRASTAYSPFLSLSDSQVSHSIQLTFIGKPFEQAENIDINHQIKKKICFLFLLIRAQKLSNDVKKLYKNGYYKNIYVGRSQSDREYLPPVILIFGHFAKFWAICWPVTFSSTIAYLRVCMRDTEITVSKHRLRI